MFPLQLDTQQEHQVDRHAEEWYNDGTEKHPFPVGVPDGLLEYVREVAKAYPRSRNGETIWVLIAESKK